MEKMHRNHGSASDVNLLPLDFFALKIFPERLSPFDTGVINYSAITVHSVKPRNVMLSAFLKNSPYQFAFYENQIFCKSLLYRDTMIKKKKKRLQEMLDEIIDATEIASGIICWVKLTRY